MRQIRRFLDTEIGPRAEVMIASFDRSLRIHQGFTTERVAVTQALEKVEAVLCTGVRFQTNRADLLEIVDTASHSAYAVNTLKPYIHSVGNDLSMTISGLEEMLNLLAGLPGRKEVLYVASCLPRVLGGELLLAIEHKFAETSAPPPMPATLLSTCSTPGACDRWALQRPRTADCGCRR